MANFDWIIIVTYLVFTLVIGISVSSLASKDRVSYFLADKSLPWWWAGISIAATTFAADTPLAITGIVAQKGLSGNWMWLSWMGVHAAVFVVFARYWRRSNVITDVEFISIRYSGKPASFLALFRAGLFGVVYNAIIMGWVLRAMGKIVEPFFHWEKWTPEAVGALERIWPEHFALSDPSQFFTILLLLGLVALYSTLGGIRGVIFTDLMQFAIGIFGSIWFAVVVWNAVGGQQGLMEGLTSLYGADQSFTNLLPDLQSGWAATLNMGAFAFGVYLFIQSYANMPGDGGGYLMQRLNTTKDETHAQKAALLFLFIQYVGRVWPWFIVGLGALVLIPLGAESGALDGSFAFVAKDRELAYSALMGYLLPTGALGLLITSLLAAFMSTIDTHINWGASYVVNDVFLKIKPNASQKTQIKVARASVLCFALLAVLVCLHISTIEQAWKWVACLGAALGIPTITRWLWWRINATAEICGMAAGFSVAFVLVFFPKMAYEMQLVWISGASLVGTVLGALFGPPNDSKTIENFQNLVNPEGFWPNRSRECATKQLLAIAAKISGTVLLIILVLLLTKWVLLGQ